MGGNFNSIFTSLLSPGRRQNLRLVGAKTYRLVGDKTYGAGGRECGQDLLIFFSQSACLAFRQKIQRLFHPSLQNFSNSHENPVKYCTANVTLVEKIGSGTSDDQPSKVWPACPSPEPPLKSNKQLRVRGRERRPIANHLCRQLGRNEDPFLRRIPQGLARDDIF